jgi:phage terminase large subunit-like protein
MIQYGWRDTDEEALKLPPGSVFDRKKADKAVRFVERCYKALNLTLSRYQRLLVMELYGTVQPVTELRQYRWLYFSVARKNAKSTLAACLALYHLYADSEQQPPRIYLAATNLDQTRETFEIAVAVVEAIPTLNQSSIIKQSDNRKEIHRLRNGRRWGYIQCLTRGGAKEGKNPSLVIFDELHQWTEADAPLWASMTTGSKARKQPLFIITTTAGRNAEGLCYEKYEYAKKVLRGEHRDPTFMGRIWEADPHKWMDPEEWKKSNPLVAEGFISIENIRANYYQAAGDPRALAEFKRTDLNVWAGHFDSYLNVAKWNKQTAPVLDKVIAELPCVAAFDLSRTTDFTCFLMLWIETLTLEEYRRITKRKGEKVPEEFRRRYYIRPHFFLPEEGIAERCKKDGKPYEDWAEADLLTLCPGAEVDYGQVYDRIKESRQAHKIEDVAYDPYNAAFLVQALIKDGMKIAPFRQGYLSMSAPLKETRRLINEGLIVHGNNPVMDWQVPQLVIVEDESGNVKPTKKSRTRKIDGPVTLVMAVGAAMRKKWYKQPGSHVLMDAAAENKSEKTH